jgi:hypothetical protein
MITTQIDSFGRMYTLTGAEIGEFESLKLFIEEEEKFILKIKKEYKLEVREDLLVLFVQLYVLRFAIPYYQMLHNEFPGSTHIVFLRKILYTCLIGRFIDDLIDKDSEMFKTYESILLFQKYYQKLSDLLTNEDKIKFDSYLFDSTVYKSPVIKSKLTFNHIRTDIYERIKYFFVESEKFSRQMQELLKSYVCVLLANLDISDLIADGYLKNSSTVISNYAYKKFYNDEKKLLLDQKLLHFYTEMKTVLLTENKTIIDYCYANQLHYTANILKKA